MDVDSCSICFSRDGFKKCLDLVLMLLVLVLRCEFHASQCNDINVCPHAVIAENSNFSRRVAHCQVTQRSIGRGELYCDLCSVNMCEV